MKRQSTLRFTHRTAAAGRVSYFGGGNDSIAAATLLTAHWQMLIPAFTLELNNPILKRLADIGKYDGEHPSLTCATAAGKIFFHTPHEKDAQNEVKFLNINRKISAIACGKLATKHGRWR